MFSVLQKNIFIQNKIDAPARTIFFLINGCLIYFRLEIYKERLNVDYK